MLPTVVLMRDGREIDRITGYTGSEAFLTLVHRLLRRAE